MFRIGQHDLPQLTRRGVLGAVGLVVVLVAYPLSFGPACWITSRLGYGDQLVTQFYFEFSNFQTKNNDLGLSSVS
jgi:hypothetical protein